MNVERLRREARERARTRPRLPFAGTVADEMVAGVAARSYFPDPTRPSYAVVFLHGGYGLLGDLDTQDGYCRQLAGGLGARVVSAAYALAPEGTLAGAAAQAVAVAESLNSPVILCGDSAGGAVALLAATLTSVHALLLTNPNVDLSLALVDDAATSGPDRDTTAWSFARWAPDSPDLAAGLPDVPVFVAVGDQDSLLPEARHLAETAHDSVLLELPGQGHGFMGDAAVAAEVVAAMAAFVSRVGARRRS